MAVRHGYDSSVAVKRVLLSEAQRLDIAKVDRLALRHDVVKDAVEAAKTLRHRIVREYERVKRRVEIVKQQMYHAPTDLREAGGFAAVDEDDAPIVPEAADGPGESRLMHARTRKAIQKALEEDQSHLVTRMEYTYLGELQIVERVVIPALIAHSLQYPDTLLPQLLKLIAAMTLPVLVDTPDVTKQQDVFNSIRLRCSTDDFFLLLVHAVAPIASRRKDGPVPERDALLLEVVLSVTSNLLQGPMHAVEPVVGALCRNHGVELVLVILTQNFEKFEALTNEAAATAAAKAAAMSAAAEAEGDDSASEDEEWEGDNEEAPRHEDHRDEPRLPDAPPLPSSAPAGVPQAEAASSSSALEGAASLVGLGPAVPSSGGMAQRAETQLVVLPDSQFDGMDPFALSSLAAAAAAPPTSRTPLGFVPDAPKENRTAPVDGFILYTDAGEELIVFDDTVTATTPAGPWESAADDDAIEIDLNAPPVVAFGDEDDGVDDAEKSSDRKSPSAVRADAPVGGFASSEEDSAPSSSDDDEVEDEDEGSTSESSQDEDEASDSGLVVLKDDEALIQQNPRLAALAEDYQRESLATLRRWNDSLLDIVSLVFRCAPAADLSLLALSLQRPPLGHEGGGAAAATQHLSAQVLQTKLAEEFRRQQVVDDGWRRVAKSRNGAFSTNSIMIRKAVHRRIDDEFGDTSGAGIHGRNVTVLGTTSELLMNRHTDPLGQVKEMDRKKKGRFHRKMLEPPKAVSVLPLPTQLQLAQQFGAFLSFGFENLSTMLWPVVHQQVRRLEQNVADTMVAGHLRADGPLLSVTDDVDVKEVFNYFFLCGTLLRFTRENLKHVITWRQERRKRSAQESLLQHSAAGAGTQIDPPPPTTADEEEANYLLTFEAQWKAVSHVLTLDHIQSGFTLLECCTNSKELASECDVTILMSLVAELVLMLIHLMDGDIVEDAAVTMAAHAMGSSLLYREANIRVVYTLIGQLSLTQRPALSVTQPLMLLLHSVLMLIDKCSFHGVLALPKIRRPGAGGAASGKHDTTDGDDVPITDAANAQDGNLNDEDDDEEMDNEYEEIDEDEIEDQNDALSNNNNKDDRGDGTPIAESPRELVERDERATVAAEDEGAINSISPAPPPPPLSVSSPTALPDPLEDEVPIDDDDGNESLHDSQVEEAANDSETRVSGKATSAVDPLRGVEREVAVEMSTGDALHEAPVRSRSRAASDAESASVIHSSHTGHTSMTSEREVKVQDFYNRLATPKYIPIVLHTLRTWATNDADVNLALCAILENFASRSFCANILFNFPFLIVFHEILTKAQESHGPLFEVVDRIAYQFFNPGFAKSATPLFAGDGLDHHTNAPLVSPNPTGGGATNGTVRGMESGSMSALGTEVAFRCTRALFVLPPTYYSILEEAGMPAAFSSSIVIPLPGEVADVDEAARGDGGRKRRKKRAIVADAAEIEADSLDEDGGVFPSEGYVEAEVDLANRTAPPAVPSHTKDTHKKTTAKGDAAEPRRRRRRGQAAASGDAVPAFSDVTNLAKEVDAKERRRGQRRRHRESSSGENDGEEAEGEDRGAKKKDRKRQRREERLRAVMTSRRTRLAHGDAPLAEDDDKGGAEQAQAPAVGSIITGEDGNLYLVHDDGYAYQVEGDEENGYHFVAGQEPAVVLNDDDGAPETNTGPLPSTTELMV